MNFKSWRSWPQSQRTGLKRIAIFGGPSGDDAAEIIASGLVAGNYRFDKYRADKDRKASLESVLINGSGGQGSDRGLKLGEARNLTRDLVNAPPAEVYPESLAAVCAELASDTTVTIWDAEKLNRRQVNHCSWSGIIQSGCFVHMHYKPSNARKSIAMVGKGYHFRCGGLSIKSSGGMQTMRWYGRCRRSCWCDESGFLLNPMVVPNHWVRENMWRQFIQTRRYFGHVQRKVLKSTIQTLKGVWSWLIV